jgi:radical SAM protein with 4Fe4S-binding SPASM domain
MCPEGSDWDKKKYLSHGEDWWPPHQVRLELVEGCALRCHSCGVAGIRRPGDGTLRFMAPSLVRHIAGQIDIHTWKTILVLSGRGEPAHHPDLDHIIMVARDSCFQAPIMLETSGHGLLDFRLTQDRHVGQRFVDRTYLLMENGLTAMVLARRAETARIWDQVDAMAEDACWLLEARLERSEVTHIPGRWDRVLCLLRDQVRAPHVPESWRIATSHCGAGARPWPTYKQSRQKKIRLFCGRPAQQLCVRYDGMVTVCQEDWRGEVCLGNAAEQSLYDIWYSPLARAVRARAMASLRDLRPCSHCDYSGDQFMLRDAQHMVVQPTSEHRDLVVGAQLAEPMTPPVRRPWEV